MNTHRRRPRHLLLVACVLLALALYLLTWIR